MDLNKLMGYAFNIFFVVVLLLIIFYALRIMSKDVGTKDKSKSKKNNVQEKPPVAKANKSDVKKIEKPITRSERPVKRSSSEQVASKPQRPVRTEDKKSFGLKVQNTIAGSGLEKGTIIPMRNITTIGRKEGNSIVLSDKFVSSNHAKLYVQDNTIVLEDLNSTNGTFVNDNRISGKIRIGVNDSIRLGSTVFRIIG